MRNTSALALIVTVLVTVLNFSANTFALGKNDEPDWSGQVVMLESHANIETILFKLSGELKKPAACNESETYTINLKYPGAQNMIDLVKYAYLHQLPVNAFSNNTCLFRPGSESVRSIILKNE